MKKYVISLLLCVTTVSVHATSWTGTSTTYGNTTYHNFHSNGVQILEANPRCNYRNNDGAALAVV